MTLLHTSFSRSAVISCSLLWRVDGYPPVGQDSACAIVNNCSQTQSEAGIGGDQPHNVSQVLRILPFAST